VTVGDEFAVYAAGYDADENYISDVIATWSTTGGLDPVPAGPAASVIFAPTTAGTAGAITANDGSDHTGATGTVTVVAREGDTCLLFLPYVARVQSKRLTLEPPSGTRVERPKIPFLRQAE